MRRSLRQTVPAVMLVAVVLLALASPAAATPREVPAEVPSLTGPQVFAELLASMGQWLDGVGLDRVFAPAGDEVDSDPETGPPGASDPTGGGATQEGGHAIDPNG